jgi:hypothetical protein
MLRYMQKQYIAIVGVIYPYTKIIIDMVSVSDRKGLNQPACQEEWKKCRRKRRIVMLM